MRQGCCEDSGLPLPQTVSVWENEWEEDGSGVLDQPASQAHGLSLMQKTWKEATAEGSS